jgi:rSAM/selenodomain-associated transferase 2
MSLPSLAVVIPARDEALRLPLLLADLAAGVGLICELIVVDGASGDATARVAALAGARVCSSAVAGRGAQLQLGIASSSATWLWLLHADARLPARWPQQLAGLLEREAASPPRPRAWYGDLRIDLPGPQLRLLEMAVAWRSALLQRPYGDPGLLMRRSVLEQVGGLQPLPLMEDLEFAERFARSGRFCRLGFELRVSGRRWRRLGVLRTAWANAGLRRAWRQGANAAELAARYQR